MPSTGNRADNPVRQRRIALEIRKYFVISVFIGVGLSVIDWSGVFLRPEAAIFGFDSGTVEPFSRLDGFAAIVVSVVLPGIAILRWGQEKGLIMTLAWIGGYGLWTWCSWTYTKRPLPIMAPGIACLLGTVRAYGYGLSYAEKWWTPTDPLFGAAKLKRKWPLMRFLFAFRIPAESSLGADSVPQAFISYRREGGAEAARLIRAALQERGYNTFLDVDDLRASHFDERLLGEIERARNFILILSPGSLDRCADERDWIRREVEHAIRTNRNIIPIVREGFRFPDPDALPPAIAELPRFHCLSFSHEFFDAMIEKLVASLVIEER